MSRPASSLPRSKKWPFCWRRCTKGVLFVSVCGVLCTLCFPQPVADALLYCRNPRSLTVGVFYLSPLDGSAKIIVPVGPLHLVEFTKKLLEFESMVQKPNFFAPPLMMRAAS